MKSISKSFSRTLFLNMSLLVVISIGLLGTLWVFHEYSSFNRQAEQMRAVQLNARKAELKQQVEIVVDHIRFKKSQTEGRVRESIKSHVLEVHALATHIHATNKAEKSLDEIQAMVREAMRALRFNKGRGYYFAMSLAGVDQLFPDKPELEGKNLLELQDANGAYVFKDMIELIRRQGEGFYAYRWGKPLIPDKDFRKISYIKYFAPFDWFIGTGEYYDDMEADIKQEVLDRIEQIRFGREGHIFAGQWDGFGLAGPGKGEQLLSSHDPGTERVVQQLIDLARADGGYIYYLAPKILGSREALKTSYVMGVDEWQWYVCAGEYLDDIEKSLAMEKEAMVIRLRENIAVTFILFACLLVASFLIARTISRKTKNNFATLNSFFHRAALETTELDSRSLDFIEFQMLAESVNRMVAERNRVMAALAENESRYRALFDSASDAIMIVQNDLFIDCNQQALKMFACGREQMLGQSPGRFSPPIQPDGSNSEEKVRENNRRALAGKPQFFRWTHQRCGGALFEVEVSLSAVDLADKTFIQAIVRDISDRIRTEKQLTRQASALEQTAEEIVITDNEGVIEYANPAFEKITGYLRAEAIGMLYSSLQYHQEDQADKEMWATIRAGEVWRGRVTTRRKDDIAIEADATVSPIFDPTGNYMGYVFVKRDVTEQIKVEKMFRQSQKMEAIGTLAGGIAHDFNNILSAIFGFTEIAKLQIPETENAYKCLGKILEAAGRARDLVKQILTFSRQTAIKPQPIQLKIIAKETIKLLEASLPTTISIRSNFLSDESVLADPTSLHQLVMNLCTNAGHAMRKAGGELDISLISVELDQDFARIHPEIKPGQFVRLTVSDTGHGMTPEVKERIFDPFFTTKGEGEGTGMGLSVVHGIVRNLGGAVTVHSEPGKGSSFMVYLPVHAGRKDREKKEDEKIPGGTEHIIFVDDEEFIVDIAEQMLQLLGYKVAGKTDSREALGYFRQHAEEVDLVITDYTMPRMTGLDLAREIRKIRPDLPILLCTGYNTGFSETEIKEAGINAFILKPVVRKELAAIVRKVLDGRKKIMATESR
ncbi:MAG: cache domain-containing protein [Deltaproteobacteria bacterium]|nr:cache domain-containing protein [Deltaproteobacteria bacterium]